MENLHIHLIPKENHSTQSILVAHAPKKSNRYDKSHQKNINDVPRFGKDDRMGISNKYNEHRIPRVMTRSTHNQPRFHFSHIQKFRLSFNSHTNSKLKNEFEHPSNKIKKVRMNGEWILKIWKNY
jgi:hypothetical protein